MACTVKRTDECVVPCTSELLYPHHFPRRHILLGSLFSVSYTASLTAEPGHLLPPHCVNDTHWCNIFFQWKGKLIIGSYRACDDPVPGNAECLGGVQDVLKAVHRERSLCGKWLLRHWKLTPSPIITRCYQVVSPCCWTCCSPLPCLSSSVNITEQFAVSSLDHDISWFQSNIDR